MAINYHNQSDVPDPSPPQGNLEELFRHHLAQAELAPRPLVWDRIDNSLLVRQNELYRRRLKATRWVAAASLVLASMAGAGWWARQPAAPLVAAATTALGPGGQAMPARPLGARAGLQPGLAATVRAPLELPLAVTPGITTGQGTLANHGPAMMRQAFQSRTTAHETASDAAASTALEQRLGALLRAARFGNSAAYYHLEAADTEGAAFAAIGRHGSRTTTAFRQAAFVSFSHAALGPTTTDEAMTTDAAASNSWAWELLAPRTAGLVGLAAGPMSLPAAPARVAVVPNEAAPPLKRWQFGASYAAGVFQPNVDFSRQGSATDASNATTTNALALNKEAASEYRNNLQGGLDQRLSLRATRVLGGHWALSTGVEVGQHEAQSATTTSFVGQQLAFASPSSALRTTSFRYRTAGVPIELRYANPIKRGWGLYGRFGAAVSALLNAHSEVAGDPEATKTYSLASSNSPYRRLLATLRGGAGVHYRPAAGHWALSAGPTAELGVLSLNSQPVQDFIHQSRPYSFGLEATVDFGGVVKLP